MGGEIFPFKCVWISRQKPQYPSLVPLFLGTKRDKIFDFLYDIHAILPHSLSGSGRWRRPSGSPPWRVPRARWPERCAAQQQNRAPQNHIALVAGLDAGIFGLSGLLGLIVRVLRAADGALAVLIVVALGGDHLTPGQQLAALTALNRSSAPLVEALAQLLSRQ